MMSEITVNGVKICSSKSIEMVVDTVVHYTDGSWIDVATGSSLNNGLGSISLGVAPQSMAKIKTTSASFPAMDVRVADLNATVNIQPHTGTKVEISITGPEELVNKVVTEQVGDCAVIRSINSSANLVVYNTVGTTTVSNNTPKISVQIKVPKYANIAVSNINGLVTVGDTHGLLNAIVSGSGEVVAGTVRELYTRVTGSASVSVREVKVEADVKVYGSGKAVIHTGTMQKLDISVSSAGSANVYGGTIGNLKIGVSGSAKARVDADAKTANLEASGVGQIYVQKVEGFFTKSVSGLGTITRGDRNS